MQISHVIYLVPDTGRAVAFLSGILGFEITADETTITGDRFLTMGLPGGGVQLQVVESSFQSAVTEKKRAAGHVDFILQTDNIHALVDAVSQAGLVIHRQPTAAPYGITAIFEDPFGNLWDLVERPQMAATVN